jgi:hypothetical protein
VYELFTGHRTFFSDLLPGIGSNTSRHYHLLTFADGIDCLFLLFVVNISINRGNNIRNIQVQTATSMCGTWAPATMIDEDDRLLRGAML